MLVLDWRPAAERLVNGGGTGVWTAAASLARPVAGALADAFCALRASRRPASPADILVVSLGNLRVGGTGKTPVTLALARDLEDRGRRGAILLRGYGSGHRGPLIVEPQDLRASDEARLLASGLRSRRWSVVQSRNRSKGLDRIRSGEPMPEIVLLDDGFQTPGVGRHLDVLILDSWTLAGGRVRARTGGVLPFGPYRETAHGAARAHVWLLESEKPPLLPCLQQKGAPIQILGFQRQHFLQPTGRHTMSDLLSETLLESVGLLCGLARPEAFETAARRLLGRSPALSIRCRDHSPYDRRLMDRIEQAGQFYGISAWVTTEKDWIKLQGVWPAGLPAYLVRQGVVWTGRKTLPALAEERLASLGRKALTKG